MNTERLHIREGVFWLNRHRHAVFFVLYAVFVIVASFATHKVAALPATRWMNMFNFGPFESWAGVRDHLWNLRTGVPPALSAVEVISFKLTGSYEWVIKGLYRKSLILMLILPLFFTRRTLRDYLVHYPMTWILLYALLKVVMGNAQVYDVLLPVFLMLFLGLMWQSQHHAHRPGRQAAMVGLAGFFLSMAELSRPFMLALMPVLLAWAIALLWKRKQQWIWFLAPLLLFSGGWHAKLLVRHGQLIWSNHAGSNLVGAWAPLLDHPTLEASLEPEEPPLEVNEWTWDNLNTEVHYRNSAKRKAAVAAAIKAQPGAAWEHFLHKIGTFTEPQVGMYAWHPDGPEIDAYRWLVHVAYWLLAFLLLRAAWLFVRDWRYVFSLESLLLGTTTFLTLMPVIGESGEEARFLISVLPFLVWVWLRAVGVVERQMNSYLF